ncbi:MAG: hypothetical protein GY853_00665 [PVC group bacterium]|nr:hypothetical protein [PVC group bacterium]
MRNLGRKIRHRTDVMDMMPILESIEAVLPYLEINYLKIVRRLCDEWIMKKKNAILQKEK